MKQLFLFLSLTFITVPLTSQITNIIGPTSVTINSTSTFQISGFICPPPDDCNYSLTCPSPYVNIVNVAPGGCSRDFNVTFTQCGTYVLTGLRPCQGYNPGTITVTVSGPNPLPPFTNVPTTICSGQSTNLSGTCSSGTIAWYSSSCGNNLVGTGSPVNTGVLTSTTTFYARCEDSCGNSFCSSSTVSVANRPNSPILVNASPSSGCASFNTQLNGICSSGTLRWYTLPLGLGSGISANQTINSNSTFYAKCVVSSNPSSCVYSSPTSIFITVYNNTYDTIYDTICQGQTYPFNGQLLSTSGSFKDTLINVYGCDNIITLLLMVNPNSFDTIYDTICQGQTYPFNGQLLNSTGSFNDTLINVYGCDSIITLFLVVNPNSFDTIYDTICQGQTYTFNGQLLNSTGSFNDTLINILGCDSVRTLFLMVNPNSFDTIYDTICQGQTYPFNGQLLSTSGSFNDTLISITGCDSIINLFLFVKPLIIDTNQVIICEGNSYNFNGINYYLPGIYSDTISCDSIVTIVLSIDSISRTNITLTSCDSILSPSGLYYWYSSGTYYDTLLSSSLCDSIINVSLTINNKNYYLVNDSICDSVLNPSKTKYWYYPGTYYDTLKSLNSFDCDTIFTVNLYSFCNTEIIIPQFLTPNTDGYNDNWIIENIDKYQNNVKIYNRWGQLVYEMENYNNEWKGESNTGNVFHRKNEILPSGTYFYLIKIGENAPQVFTGYIYLNK